MNDMAIFVIIVVVLACIIIPWVRYERRKQTLKQTTRTDDEIEGYRKFLLQSPDNELSEENAAFVRSLFTPSLTGEFTEEMRPIERRERRLINRTFIRAIENAQVERFQKKNGGSNDFSTRPDLLRIYERERLRSESPRPRNTKPSPPEEDEQ
ncbi:MAG: hypothetical protein ABI977_11950 [Acidobacteriota bacterium]